MFYHGKYLFLYRLWLIVLLCIIVGVCIYKMSDFLEHLPRLFWLPESPLKVRCYSKGSSFPCYLVLFLPVFNVLSLFGVIVALIITCLDEFLPVLVSFGVLDALVPWYALSIVWKKFYEFVENILCVFNLSLFSFLLFIYLLFLWYERFLRYFVHEVILHFTLSLMKISTFSILSSTPEFLSSCLLVRQNLWSFSLTF